jgi:hypothetical protein
LEASIELRARILSLFQIQGIVQDDDHTEPVEEKLDVGFNFLRNECHWTLAEFITYLLETTD